MNAISSELYPLSLNTGNNNPVLGNSGLTGSLPNGGVNQTPNSTLSSLPIKTVFIVFLLLLIGLKFATEREVGEGKKLLDVADVGVGTWNFIAITLMAILGIVTTKLVFNKWYVRGLSEFVSAA